MVTPYDGSPPGGSRRVNTDVAGKQAAPAVLRDATGAWIAAWEDGRNGAPDVFAIAFFPDGARRGSDTQLNDDAAPFDQRKPRLGRGPGRYVATWVDRRGTAGLYGQWVTSAGARDGENHLLWHDDLTERPVASSSAVSPQGARSSRPRSRATRTPATSAASTTRLRTGRPPPRSGWRTRSRARRRFPAWPRPIRSSRRWIDGRDGEPRLYGQLLSPAGARIGGNHPVLAVEPRTASSRSTSPPTKGEATGWRTPRGRRPTSGSGSSGSTRPSFRCGIPAGRGTRHARCAGPAVGLRRRGRSGRGGLAGDGPRRIRESVYHTALSPGFSALATARIEAEPGRPAGSRRSPPRGAAPVLTWGSAARSATGGIWLQRFDAGVATGPRCASTRTSPAPTSSIRARGSTLRDAPS